MLKSDRVREAAGRNEVFQIAVSAFHDPFD